VKGGVGMAVNLNIESAIEAFYSRNELSSADIMNIFGCSRTKAESLKKEVRQEVAKIEDKTQRPIVFSAANVNTDFAFTVWGLDIASLEERFRKLQKFRKLKGA
jgi:hypothetical protein